MKEFNPSKYDPSFCKIAIEHLRSGLSLTTLGPHLGNGVALCTIYEWRDRIPEFGQAIEQGMKLGQEFFEKRLIAKISGQEIKGLKVKDIDTSCLIFALKTRFHKDYSEKTHVENSGSISINIDKQDENL